MPSGLDVMAALGSHAAVRLLEPELRKYQYSANLLAAEQVVKDLQPQAWNQSLYSRWLGALRTLDDLPDERTHFLAAMKSETWQRKQLRTALGSWAELRHDTLLYGKQSYGAGTMCEYPSGFVEPYPEFFDQLEALAHAAGARLGALPLSSGDSSATHIRDRHSKFFLHFERTMAFLAALARKELSAQPFSVDEQIFLKSTINRYGGSGPPHYDGWYPTLIYGGGPEEYKPTIADVHTYPGQIGVPQVLEVGTGRTNYVVVAVDNENDHALYVGPAFSYYEFTVAPEQRLTDDAWRERLQSGKGAPEAPAWQSSFQRPARNLDSGYSPHEFPLTPKQSQTLKHLDEEYRRIMRSYTPHMTAAQRLARDQRAHEIHKKMEQITSCGCPPGDKECPCLDR